MNPKKDLFILLNMTRRSESDLWVSKMIRTSHHYCVNCGLQKTQWTNTSRWHGSPNHHWLETSHWTSSNMDSVPLHDFLQTLGPWFPNEMQNILSSEKRTLDHWATVQLFFSLAQVRCFWCCFCFRSGLVVLFLKTSERGDSWCTDSSFSSLFVKLGFAWQYSQACGHPCWLCTFSYPISSFQSTLHLICFNTALLEQPPLSAMTLCDLPSLWKVSMIIFWTIAKSAVFPIVVFSKNKRYPQFIL